MTTTVIRASKDLIIRLAAFTDDRDVRQWPSKTIKYTDTTLEVSVACYNTKDTYCWVIRAPLPADYNGREIHDPIASLEWESGAFNCGSQHKCINTLAFRRIVSTWTLAGRLSPGVFQKTDRGFFSVNRTTRRCYVCCDVGNNLSTLYCNSRRCVDTVLRFARGAYSHWAMKSLIVRCTTDTMSLCRDTHNLITAFIVRLVIPADLL